MSALAPAAAAGRAAGPWRKTGETVRFVTRSIAEGVHPATRIVVTSPRSGRIVGILEGPPSAERPLAPRDTPEFPAIAHRVRAGLRAGHSYDRTADAPVDRGG